MKLLLVLLIITLAIEAFLHVCSVFLTEKKAKICAYINICLHLVMFFLLMALRVTIELLALSFTSSLLLYFALSYFSHLYTKKKREEEKIDDV